MAIEKPLGHEDFDVSPWRVRRDDHVDNRSDRRCTAAEFSPATPHWWRTTDGRLAMHEPFTFRWHCQEFTIEQPYSDGYTFPWFVRFLPLGLFQQFQAGVHAAFVHDYFCRKRHHPFLLWPEGQPTVDTFYWKPRPLTKTERVRIFRDALKATGKVSSRRMKALWWGVRFGSRYLGYC